jgi:FkbM family methyltransferase
MVTAVRRAIPNWPKRRVRSLAAYPDTWRLVADPGSFARFRRFENAATRRRRAEQTVAVRFREVPDAPLHLRPGTADAYLPRDTFFKAHHLPPSELDPATIRLVWDLGSNIGFTIAHLATVFARARIVGVEIDEGNARLCSKNIAPWRDRCELIRAAVWTEDEPVTYRADLDDELGFHIDHAEGNATVAGLSLNTLREHTGDAPVDYVKMDIEGTEAQVLKQNVEWAEHVRCIKVEVHPPYTVEECTEDLRLLGFATRPIPKRRGGVTGLRHG